MSLKDRLKNIKLTKTLTKPIAIERSHFGQFVAGSDDGHNWYVGQLTAIVFKDDKEHYTIDSYIGKANFKYGVVVNACDCPKVLTTMYGVVPLLGVYDEGRSLLVSVHPANTHVGIMASEAVWADSIKWGLDSPAQIVDPQCSLDLNTVEEGT